MDDLTFSFCGRLTGEQRSDSTRKKPVYQTPPLEGLLRQMAEQLMGNHGLNPSRQEPEYLHEAFQRLILEFLFANYDKKFMELGIHDEFQQEETRPK
jgi:hypothetical protein